MATFDKDSRYVLHAKVYKVTDRKGREVEALTPAAIPPQRELGEHQRRQGQRLDHLAARYLDQPTGFWRIAALNDAMSVDAIAEARIVKIPVKR